MTEVYDQVKKTLEEMPKKLSFSNTNHRLHPVLKYYHGLKKNPEDIRQDTPEGVLFFNLQICYANQKNVSEGIIEDVVWGMRQSGIPGDVTWDGFKELKKKGYMFFHDGTGTAVLGDPNDKLWYRWTKKYFDLLSEVPLKDVGLKVEDKVKGKDTNWEKVE